LLTLLFSTAQHLAPFREKTGLTDLRAYDNAVSKAREDFVAKRTGLRQHRAKLEAQLTYEDGRDFISPVSKVEKTLAGIVKKLEDAEKKEEGLVKTVESAKKKLAEAVVECDKASKEEKEAEKKAAESQKEFAEAQSERIGISKSMNTEDAELERLRGELHEILQKARVEEVELPMIKQKKGKAGEEEEDDEDDGWSQASGSQDSQQGNSQGSTHFSQESDKKVKKDKRDAAKVDFSGLKSELRARLTSDRDEKKIRSKFEERLARVALEIESMAPNMKANAGERAKRASLLEDKHTRDEVREMATDGYIHY